MTPFVYLHVDTSLLFFVAWAIWFIAEMWYVIRDRGKVTDKQDRDSKRALLIFMFTGIFLALSFAWFHLFIIEFFPLSVFIGGISLMMLGVIMRFLAVQTLGRFFRRSVMTQKGHRVITSGLYKYIRHPSYTGAFITFLGIGLVLGNWLSVLSATLVSFIGYFIRMNVEEDVLQKKLGNAYKVYMRHTKRLIPFIY